MESKVSSRRSLRDLGEGESLERGAGALGRTLGKTQIGSMMERTELSLTGRSRTMESSNTQIQRGDIIWEERVVTVSGREGLGQRKRPSALAIKRPLATSERIVSADW